MSQKAKKIRVDIVNPIQGEGTTSLAHARRYIRRGAAEWVVPDKVLRMVASHKCREGAQRSAITRRGEGIGMAGLAAVEGLPVAGDAIKVFVGRRPNVPIVDYSVIEVSRRLLPIEAW